MICIYLCKVKTIHFISCIIPIWYVYTFMDKGLGRKLTIRTYREVLGLKVIAKIISDVFISKMQSYTKFVISNVKKKQYAENDTF